VVTGKTALLSLATLCQVTKNNYLAHNSLGLVLFEEGKIKEAIYHYNQAIRIRPDFARGYNTEELLIYHKATMSLAALMHTKRVHWGIAMC